MCARFPARASLRFPKSDRLLDAEIKAGLRLRAAAHDRSMEEEVRQILKQAVQSPGGD
ncbi:MAG: FitA-like ribbon-helix-helix domain-containing protein [Methylococcales bacterium]